MIILDRITYDFKDLINLIKNNTALLANTKPDDLFVQFEFKNKEVKAFVIRKDKKKINI